MQRMGLWNRETFVGWRRMVADLAFYNIGQISAPDSEKRKGNTQYPRNRTFFQSSLHKCSELMGLNQGKSQVQVVVRDLDKDFLRLRSTVRMTEHEPKESKSKKGEKNNIVA